MGTSASYKGPNWPSSSSAVDNAASAGVGTPASVGVAVSTFARDYGTHVASSGGGGTGGGGSGSARDGAGARGGGGGRGGRGGGSRTRAAAAGARLAHFLGTSQDRGLREALREFNLEEYRDASVEQICDALVEALTDPDGLLEDTALRDAMDRTMEELTKDAQTADELDALFRGKDMNIAEVVAEYYCNVLAVNFEVKEFDRIRDRMSDVHQAREFLNNAREYIRGFVEYRLSKEVDLTKYDLNSPKAMEMADRLNREVIDAIGRHD